MSKTPAENTEELTEKFLEFAQAMNYDPDELADIIVTMSQTSKRSIERIINYLHSQKDYYVHLQQGLRNVDLMNVLSQVRHFSYALNALNKNAYDIIAISRYVDIDQRLKEILSSDDTEEDLSQKIHQELQNNIVSAYNKLYKESTTKFRDLIDLIMEKDPTSQEEMMNILSEEQFLREICSTDKIYADPQVRVYTRTKKMPEIKTAIQDLAKQKLVELFVRLDNSEIPYAAEFRQPQDVAEITDLRRLCSANILDKVQQIEDANYKFNVATALLANQNNLENIYQNRFFHEFNPATILCGLIEVTDNAKYFTQALDKACEEMQSLDEGTASYRSQHEQATEEPQQKPSDLPLVAPRKPNLSTHTRTGLKVTFSPETTTKTVN